MEIRGLSNPSWLIGWIPYPFNEKRLPMKQDLRYIKTEKAIHEAFHQLLKEKNVQKN